MLSAPQPDSAETIGSKVAHGFHALGESTFCTSLAPKQGGNNGQHEKGAETERRFKQEALQAITISLHVSLGLAHFGASDQIGDAAMLAQTGLAKSSHVHFSLSIYISISIYICMYIYIYIYICICIYILYQSLEAFAVTIAILAQGTRWAIARVGLLHGFNSLCTHFCRQTWKHRNTDTATASRACCSLVERAAR